MNENMKKKSPTLLIVEQEKKSIRKGYNHTPKVKQRYIRLRSD